MVRALPNDLIVGIESIWTKIGLNGGCDVNLFNQHMAHGLEFYSLFQVYFLF